VSIYRVCLCVRVKCERVRVSVSACVCERVTLCLYVHLEFGVGCKRGMGRDRVFFLAFSENNFLPRTQIAGILREDDVWCVCVCARARVCVRENDDG
jgi:hypothetical protein